MKKAKFWLSQIILVAIVSLVLSSPALAVKPSSQGSGKCAAGETKVKGQCVADSGSSTDGGSTDGGSTSTTGPDDCPDGWFYLDLYGYCILP